MLLYTLVASYFAAVACYSTLDFPDFEYDPLYYSHDEMLSQGYSVLAATQETIAEMKEIFVDSFIFGNEHPLQCAMCKLGIVTLRTALVNPIVMPVLKKIGLRGCEANF